MERTDIIMMQMGFHPSDRGPNVTALRASIDRQVRDNGLVGASYGSWVDNPNAEERAREHLALEWALQRGHSHQVKNFDSNWNIGDQWRAFLMQIRVWRDKLLGNRNPYRKIKE